MFLPRIPTRADTGLSPIQEEPDDATRTVTKSGSSHGLPDNKPKNGQRNINSPFESEMCETAKFDEAKKPVDESLRKATSTETFRLQDANGYRSYREHRRIPEPVRKPDVGVEVLKQTYLNKYIQDIPRFNSGFLSGPVRFGRLHRSRSQHGSVSSQAIRTHMKILRTKSGTNTAAMNPKLQFRCSRFAEDAEKLTGKTLEELLSVDTYPDDYDPELARLFDDYVEACDQITRGDFTPDTVLPRSVDRLESSVNKPVEAETKEAFWRGFMEGMSHSNHTHAHDTVVKDGPLAVTGESPREVTQDPFIDKTSHSDMIRNNQDITHRFLKEWESTNSLTDLNGNTKDKDSCFACTAEHTLLSDLLISKPDGAWTPMDKEDRKRSCATKSDLEKDPRDGVHVKGDVVTVEDRNTPVQTAVKDTQPDDDKGESETTQPAPTPVQVAPTTEGTKALGPGVNESKKPKRGSQANISVKPNNRLLPLISSENAQQGSHGGKLNGPLIETKPLGPPKVVKPERHHNSRFIKKTVGPSPISTAGPFMTVNMNNYTASGRSNSRTSPRTGSRSETACRTNSVTEGRGSLTPRQEKAVDRLSRMRDVFDEEVFREYAFRDENISIITLAKMKLENKYMSSLALENALRLRSEAIRAQTPSCRSKEPGRNHEAMVMRSVIRDLDLDGWDAETKPFCEQDNLHMSSSELLHPVDSVDSFSSISSPWQPANSSTLLTSIEKNLQCDKGKEQESGTMTTNRATPTGANLSDLTYYSNPKRKFETSAFKPSSHTLKNKFVERVKLRLTKSCDSFGTKGGHYKDSAFTNTPLAPCLSYSIEKGMKRSLPMASSINLSESLALQLKQLGKDKNAAGPRLVDTDTTYPDLNQDDIPSTDDKETKQVTTKTQLITGYRITTKTTPNHPSSRTEKANPDKSRPDNVKTDTTVLPKIESRCSTPARESISTDCTNGGTVTQTQSLPPISCTSLFTSKVNALYGNKATAVKKSTPTARLLHYDDESELWMNRSIPCRAESLQTPYTFDRADPSKLLLKTRALSNLHSVCTSCGGINKRNENTSGHERSTTLGVVTKGKVMNLHHRCVTPGNDEKWRLEAPAQEPSQQLPEIGVSKFPARNLDHTNKPLELKKEVCTDDYSKYERTKRARNNEMNFRFLDQNIKLRFEVEMKNDDKATLMQSSHGPTTRDPSSRLMDIAKPNRRDELECPLVRETRIYREKSRQKHLLSTGDKDRKNVPSPSPYLEYCKKKAHLQSLKEASNPSSCVDLMQDVGVTEAQTGNKHQKKFPVLQAKTSKKDSRKYQRKSSKQVKSLKAYSPIEERTSTAVENLSVEPGILPAVCQVSPRRGERKTKQKTGHSDQQKQDRPTDDENKRNLLRMHEKIMINVDLTPKYAEHIL